LLRISPEDVPSTLKHFKDIVSGFAPHRPFEFFFLDDHIDNLYRAEERFCTVFGYACLLALIVACLGLFGLASFMTQQRTREIGVRRVLGASISSITLMFSREFAALVAAGNLLAWPVAYYLMTGWLQNYRFRVDFDIRYLLLAGAITLLLALLTVGYKSFRSACVNPADTLRCE
jgi:putative ABC transport system permease protein